MTDYTLPDLERASAYLAGLPSEEAQGHAADLNAIIQGLHDRLPDGEDPEHHHITWGSCCCPRCDPEEAS